LSVRSKIAFQGFHIQDGLLNRRSISEWEEYIKYDTEQCIKWVADNLGFIPELYCFPFNEHNEKLIPLLKSFGLNKFFAARPGKSTQVLGRLDIDSLVDD